jgi:ribose 5-phosphate isomerase B
MQIFIGADHRGFELKEELKGWLVSEGYEVVDCGAKKLDLEDDYNDFATEVAKSNVKCQMSPVRRAQGKNVKCRGVVICGSGVGVDVAANRFKGVRCGLGINPKQVAVARRDDDINILALAADFVTREEAGEMVKTFLETEFKGGEKYMRRIRKLDEVGVSGK